MACWHARIYWALTVDLASMEGAEQAISVGRFLAAPPFIRHVQGLALRRHARN